MTKGDLLARIRACLRRSAHWSDSDAEKEEPRRLLYEALKEIELLRKLASPVWPEKNVKDDPAESEE